MDNYPITQTSLIETVENSTCVPATSGRVADEVERDDIVGHVRHGVEQFDDSLPGQPVRYTEGGHQATTTEACSLDTRDAILVCSTAEVHILTGLDDQESLGATDPP